MTYHNPVVPSKDSKFIESSNKIPPCSDVACYKDRECENGKGVHEFLLLLLHHGFTGSLDMRLVCDLGTDNRTERIKQ